MRTAAVGLWLTGLAAAGTALCVVFAPGAAPANAARFAAWRCDAGDGIGAAARVTYQLKVNGQSLDRAVLRAGDKLSTDPSGAVDICLTMGETACRIGSNTIVRVLPRKDVLLSFPGSAKRVTCETTAGKPKKLKTPQATIIVEESRRRTSATDRVAAGTSRPIYAIQIFPRKTQVTVGAGTVLVAKGDRVSNAVVVARNQMLVVRSGSSRPSRPVRRLWGAGRGKFRTRGRFSSATVGG